MFEHADIDVLHAVYATVAPPDASPDGGVQMAEAFERLPKPRAVELRTLLRLLRSPLVGMMVIGEPRAFPALDEGKRAKFLRTMAQSSVPAMRSGFAALARVALFVAYAGDNAGSRNALWERIGYPGPRDDIPAQSAREQMAPATIPDRADAIVIGSGAGGGGVAAAVLAAAGMRVLVLEAGEWPEAVAREQRESRAFAELYLEAALCSSVDGAISILAGSCVGGGTAVNWTTSLRLDANVATQWERASGGIDFGSTLETYYDAVTERLGLVPTIEHNPNNAVIVRGAEALGWKCAAQPRNASNCGDGCGYCLFGCAYGRKRSTNQTYLRDVIERGGWVVAGARVRTIVIESGRATGVHVSFDGRERFIAAERLVVCAAGALRTPALLARTGLASPHLGEHLHLHPTTGVLAEFAQPIRTWQGAMQSAYCDEFGATDEAYGVKMEVAPAHPGLAALSVPWLSRADHAERMSRAAHTAALIALVRDRAEGRVTTGEHPTVHYRLGEFDAWHLKLGIQKLAELALAAGAIRVQTLHVNPLVVGAQGSRQDFSEAVARSNVGPNRIGLFSAHQMGTARMHARSSDGVVDGAGRVHLVANLLVADGSAFPLASGVNPMLTIMALAHRAAALALERSA